MSAIAAWRSIRVVSFDAGGTLLHPHPSVGEVYGEIARAHGCACSHGDLEQGFRRAFASVSKNPNFDDGEQRERDYWRRIAKTTFRFAGAAVADFEPLFDELWEAFAHADRWRVNSDAHSTLQQLRARGHRLAIISNWDRRLHTVLAETGLRDFFDAVIISSEVGHEKPDPGIFRAAEAALAVKASQCLHVGDSRTHDLAGARGAEWQAVLVRQDEHTADGYVIGRLRQLPALLPAP